MILLLFIVRYYIRRTVSNCVICGSRRQYLLKVWSNTLVQTEISQELLMDCNETLHITTPHPRGVAQ